MALDYSIKGNYLVWSDVADEKIFIAALNKSQGKLLPRFLLIGSQLQCSYFPYIESAYAKSTPTVLVHSDIITADGLAVDWVHDLLYWTDTGKNTIEVANIHKGTDRAILINSGLDEPRAIVVNVVESFIVWSDWGDVPKIERANQDGSNRVAIVKDDIVWPNGLSIDYVTKRIYWLDAKLYTLSSVDYNGAYRETILRSEQFIKHPFALDVFEDFVYWSDWELEAVMRTNKFGSGNGTVERVVSGVFSVMDVRVQHPFMQPTTSNRCHAAKCSHLCLPTGDVSYRCMCPSGFELDAADQSTCRPLAPAPSSTFAPSPKSALPSSPVVDPHSQPAPAESTSARPHSSAGTKKAGDHSDPNSTHHQHSPIDSQTLERANLSGEGQGDGHLVLIVVAVLTTLSVFVAILVLVIYRNYQRRNITSMNFDNPVYRKTTEEQFVLEKSDHDDSLSSYPSSMEPLTSPGTNEFV